MSSARRPLLTATAAGTLLGALWFVPSANATQDSPGENRAVSRRSRRRHGSRPRATETSVDDTRLADTGSFDTTPYVVGGTLFLTLGAGFVVYSVRRERLGF